MKSVSAHVFPPTKGFYGRLCDKQLRVVLGWRGSEQVRTVAPDTKAKASEARRLGTQPR